MSGPCGGGHHDECPHEVGVRVPFIGQGYSLLCNCGCHQRCLLAGLAEVPEHRWDSECTCAGSEAARTRRKAINARRAARRAAMKAAVEAVRERTTRDSDLEAVRRELDLEVSARDLEMDEDTRIGISKTIVAVHHGNTLGILRSSLGLTFNMWRKVIHLLRDDNPET